MRALLLCVVAVFTLDAAAASGPRTASATETALLTGEGVDLVPVSVAVDRERIFGMDEEMRAFVADLQAHQRDTGVTLRKLLNAMQDRGLFALIYADDVTRTARGTFHDNRGNCLSFTMLFVALAREAGLNVRYQLVDVPPTWSWSDDLVVYGSHVNALVRTPFQPDYTVDFNAASGQAQYPAVAVDDDYVLALYLSNLGAEALLRKEYAVSLGYLRAAVAAERRYAGPWVNLGVLYGRLGEDEKAEAAYLRALDIDDKNSSALSNLANLYERRGDTKKAEEYQRRVRHYQQINPYYHYALAEESYSRGEFEPALDAVRRALRLKGDEYRFYELQGLAYRELGKNSNAVRSFLRAKDRVSSSELKARYSSLAEQIER